MNGAEWLNGVQSEIIAKMSEGPTATAASEITEPASRHCSLSDAFTACSWGLKTRRRSWPAGHRLRMGQCPPFRGDKDGLFVEEITAGDRAAVDWEVYSA